MVPATAELDVGSRAAEDSSASRHVRHRGQRGRGLRRPGQGGGPAAAGEARTGARLPHDHRSRSDSGNSRPRLRKFGSVPQVQSFTGSQRPHWMDVANPAPGAPVYVQTPGASVFKMICINCLGPKADSNGRLAQNLATMTGGNALVANFKQGLFGPPGATDDASNRHAVFGHDALLAQVPDASSPDWVDTSITDDDRASRYMAWMGLGGTSVHIPVASARDRLDHQGPRSAPLARGVAALSANISCPRQKPFAWDSDGSDLPADATQGAYLDPRPGHGYLDAKLTNLNHTLIPSNGDAELWLQLCSLSNPPPVHILRPDARVAVRLDVPTIQNSQSPALAQGQRRRRDDSGRGLPGGRARRQRAGRGRRGPPGGECLAVVCERHRRDGDAERVDRRQQGCRDARPR